jgi:hypothetical protein
MDARILRFGNPEKARSDGALPLPLTLDGKGRSPAADQPGPRNRSQLDFLALAERRTECNLVRRRDGRITEEGGPNGEDTTGIEVR